jgi:hypothetical protein
MYINNQDLSQIEPVTKGSQDSECMEVSIFFDLEKLNSFDIAPQEIIIIFSHKYKIEFLYNLKNDNSWYIIKVYHNTTKDEVIKNLRNSVILKDRINPINAGFLCSIQSNMRLEIKP